ncbi:PilZ domain-containing protein [Mucisphaera sp.]|uniref:PilZ domain-containing protein n=1 Tax=Mucisphaera sp. TaxID=2913024 RepID=UPI003D14FA71
MSQNSLRLTPAEDTEPDSFLFDRRRSLRRRMRGQVTALVFQRDEKTHQVSRRKICAMNLQDMSDTGLGVTSQETISLGDEITVFFPPHGPEKGFDLKGTIVRRGTDGDGKASIGIRCGHQIMAA